MTRFLLFLTLIALSICLLSLKVEARANSRSDLKIRAKRAPAPAIGDTPTTTTKLLTRNDRLTNAERIARGLPLRQPKRLYDATATHLHKARAS
ncbi:hypothetical protein I317_07531 [Kwoniella heveanensis CBS 569]|nr:hypothetical protein I317_07531 [Kwoniella heveanensis CBS 569]